MKHLNRIPALDISGLAQGVVKAEEVDGLVDDSGRTLDLTAAATYLDEAMRRFAGSREDSDSWLAPRLHYSLRLYRREAADNRVFHWLSLIWRPDYVEWRFIDRKGVVAEDRYLGPSYKNAYARLWWAAELIRNGSDYSLAARSFAMQDIQNSWMRMRAFRSRPLAVAAVEMLSSFDGANATSRQVARFSKAVNQTLTTTVLDAVAVDDRHDRVAVDDWVLRNRPPLDDSLYFSDLPPGPGEDPLLEEDLGPVRGLLQAVLAKTRGLEKVVIAPAPGGAAAPQGDDGMTKVHNGSGQDEGREATEAKSGAAEEG